MAVLNLIAPVPRDGAESFTKSGVDLDVRLLDFWRWSTSNLVSNATRGLLAEFVVGTALGCAKGVRDEWSPYDLQTPTGITVEVKSSAYLQAWHQRTYSRITFGIQPSRHWDAVTGTSHEDVTRQAMVYVFALLAHQDQETVDPLNLDQWVFYVLPTSILNARCPTQRAITLQPLLALEPEHATYDSLANAVERAAKRAGVPG